MSRPAPLWVALLLPQHPGQPSRQVQEGTGHRSHPVAPSCAQWSQGWGLGCPALECTLLTHRLWKSLLCGYYYYWGALPTRCRVQECPWTHQPGETAGTEQNGSPEHQGSAVPEAGLRSGLRWLPFLLSSASQPHTLGWPSSSLEGQPVAPTLPLGPSPLGSRQGSGCRSRMPAPLGAAHRICSRNFQGKKKKKTLEEKEGPQHWLSGWSPIP